MAYFLRKPMSFDFTTKCLNYKQSIFQKSLQIFIYDQNYISTRTVQVNILVIP